MAEVKRYFGSGAELSDNRASFRMLSYKTLASIASGGAMALRMEIMAAGHPKIVRGERTEETANALRATLTPAQLRGEKPVELSMGGAVRGRIMLHTPTGKKVTIMRASGSSVEVIDKNGRKFTAKESQLKNVR